MVMLARERERKLSVGSIASSDKWHSVQTDMIGSGWAKVNVGEYIARKGNSMLLHTMPEASGGTSQLFSGWLIMFTLIYGNAYYQKCLPSGPSGGIEDPVLLGMINILSFRWQKGTA